MSGLTGDRQAEFRVMLTSLRGEDLGVLDGVESGSVTLSATSRLRASGSLQLDDMGQEIDWFNMHARVDYVPEGMEGWPVGTFIMSAPHREVDEHRTVSDVELQGLLAYADRAVLKQVTHHLGSNARNLLDPLFKSFKRVPTAIELPNFALKESVYDAGTSVLTVINEVLNAGGYSALSTDGRGTLLVSKYVRPSQRPVSYRFVEGSEAIHSASWTIDRDIFAVPNVVICVGTGGTGSRQMEGETPPPLVGRAENRNWNDPFSIQNRGEVAHVETGVQAASQEIIDEIAHRILAERSAPAASLVIEHMPVPISPGDVVEFVSQGTRMRCVVQQMEYKLSPTALVKTTMKEVRE
nr:hypothetical protein [Schaalia odontolytica]